MNILIKFEDSYGCKTLFEHTTSILNPKKTSLNPNKTNVQVIGSLGNTGVFKVSKREVAAVDYVIIVFDMDGDKNSSLTSTELFNHLNKQIMQVGVIKPEYINKVILIPTFFCFETIYLFSDKFQNTIRNINSLGNRTEHKLINLYKQYYDYGVINPENLNNIEKVLPDIEIAAHEIAGSTSGKQWTPQRFHASYSKQLLQVMCINKNKKNKYEGYTFDKIIVKHEDILFRYLLGNEPWFKVEDIISGLQLQGIFNKMFCELLTLQNLSKLSEMTIDNNMKLITELLDLYNECIKGNNRNAIRNIDECRSNILSMIEGATKYNSEKIRKDCRKAGFSEKEIDIALYTLRA